MRVLLSLLLASSMVGCLSEGLEDSPADAEADVGGTSTVDQATVSEGFVSGTGVVTDDFGDEGPVDFNSRPRSLAAGMWQAILWADGALKQNGAAFAAADIDCDFGPNTTAATRNWQTTEGLSPVDGSAGPQTLGHADDFLSVEASSSTQTLIRYFGLVHDLFFIRKEGSGSANHAYQASGTNGTLRVISYGSISSCSSSFFLGP